MTEFTTGIWNTFRAIAGTSSVALALIFFCGHVLIAMTVVSIMTGASLWEAGAVAQGLGINTPKILTVDSYHPVSI